MCIKHWNLQCFLSMSLNVFNTHSLPLRWALGGGLPYIHIYPYKNDEPAPTKFFPRFFQLFFTEDTARGPGKQDSPPSRTTCLSPDFETSRLVAWNPSVASCCWQAVFLKKKPTTLNGIIVGKFYEEITPYIYIYIYTHDKKCKWLFLAGFEWRYVSCCTVVLWGYLLK